MSPLEDRVLPSWILPPACWSFSSSLNCANTAAPKVKSRIVKRVKCELEAEVFNSVSLLRYTDRTNFANGLSGMWPTLSLLSRFSLFFKSALRGVWLDLCCSSLCLSFSTCLSCFVPQHYTALSLTFASCFLPSVSFLSSFFLRPSPLPFLCLIGVCWSV